MSEVYFKCKNCGGDLKFSPGTQSLKCPYCGTENENPDSAPEVYEELDFEAAKIIGLILAVLAVGGIGYLIYYLVSNGTL